MTFSSISNTETLENCAENFSKEQACKMASDHDKTCTMLRQYALSKISRLHFPKIPWLVTEKKKLMATAHDATALSRPSAGGLNSLVPLIHVLQMQLHTDPNRPRLLETKLVNVR